MRLPPLTLREALAIHQRILESGGNIWALAADPDDMAVHLMATIVSFGAQLSKDKDVITSQMAEIAALKAGLEDVNSLLRQKIDHTIADRLEAEEEPESISDEWNTPGDLAGLVPQRSEADQTWLRALGVVLRPEDEIQVGDVQGVHWQGPANDYFDHYEQINAELAQGIAEMARRAVSEAEASVRLDGETRSLEAPEPPESTVETP